MLLCPVCHEPLVDNERGAACAGGHRFDRAREGYLYLLRSSKSGDSMGDPKSQARSRRDFLNRGYYAPLRDAMVELVRKQVSGRATSTNGPMTLLDICCGEGYYTSAMGAVPGVDAYGFDLGKEMVRLAAKRGDATYFVANMKDIPVADGAFDMVTELFAPFNEREFARVLAPEGSFYTVVPGAVICLGSRRCSTTRRTLTMRSCRRPPSLSWSERSGCLRTLRSRPRPTSRRCSR